MRKKVLISYFEYPHVNIEKAELAKAGYEVFERRQSRDEALDERAYGMDALLVQYVQVDRPVIDRLEKCKIIVRYGVGYENIDVRYATQKGITVCNVPDYGIEEVSDHTITLLFALARGLHKLDSSVRDGKFGFENAKPLFRIKGKTLGIIGFGRMSRAIFDKLRGFGFDYIAYDPYVDSAAMEAFGVKKIEIDALFAEADFISINCPYSSSTKSLVNDRRLRMMKKTAYLINTARGQIVDEEALIQALNEGRIAGAGLDVFAEEPLREGNPLLKMEQVILSPHASWYSEESIIDVKVKAAQEIIRVLEGGAPLNPVVLYE